MLARGGERLRRDPQRIGGGNKVWLMRTEEIEHCRHDCHFAKASAQFLGAQPGQGKQPVGTRLVAKQPAERAKRQGLRIGRGIGVREELSAPVVCD